MQRRRPPRANGFGFGRGIGLRLLAALALVAPFLLAGCASLPVDYERTESHALQDTGATRLGKAAQDALQAHPGQNAFHPLADGTDALLARIHLAEASERSLDLMYYVWQDECNGEWQPNCDNHQSSVYFSASFDTGKTFTKPIRVSTPTDWAP